MIAAQANVTFAHTPLAQKYLPDDDHVRERGHSMVALAENRRRWDALVGAMPRFGLPDFADKANGYLIGGHRGH